MFVVNCYFLALVLVTSVTFIKSECDDTSTCTVIMNCTYLVNLIDSNKFGNNPYISIVRKLGCGWSGNYQMVCCPNAVKAQSITEDSITSHENFKLLPKTCGSISDQDRVSGGNVTKLGDYPWMVILIYDSSGQESLECGGTMINRRYALTAAHCVTNLGTKTLKAVRVGEHDLRTEPDCTGPKNNRNCYPSVLNIPIEQIISHPDFRLATLRHDIALIRLSTPVITESDFFEPICLPFNDELIKKDLFNLSSIITGWGYTEKNVTSEILLEAKLPVISNKECGDVHNKSIQSGVGFAQMCAGHSGIATCNGDSGGPLIIEMTYDGGKKSFIQYGIVNFGHRICGSKVPAVFTRVAHYMNWILDQLRE